MFLYICKEIEQYSEEKKLFLRYYRTYVIKKCKLWGLALTPFR